MDLPLAASREKVPSATNVDGNQNRRKYTHHGTNRASKQQKKKKAAHHGRTKEKGEAKKEVEDDRIKISKEEINMLPIIRWEGPVRLLRTAPAMIHAVQEILNSGETHLGFDTETKPVFVKGGYNRPALIQLATANTVYLFRICETEYQFTPLLPLLTSPTILKTGVGIDQDVAELQRVLHFEPGGFVDLSSVTRKIVQSQALRALAAHFMQGRITKGQQMSNWAAQNLTPAQIRYAATDAWVSREIQVLALQAAAEASS